MQSGSISGTISDADTHKPLSGANADIKGTFKGTTVEFNGQLNLGDISPES